MAEGIRRPIGMGAGVATRVFVLCGGPRDGERWELPGEWTGLVLIERGGRRHRYAGGPGTVRLEYCYFGGDDAGLHGGRLTG